MIQIGEDITSGKLPRSEMDLLHRMVKDICCGNAQRHFGL